MMRRGPQGPRTLCNACGLMYANKGVMRPPERKPRRQVGCLDSKCACTLQRLPFGLDSAVCGVLACAGCRACMIGCLLRSEPCASCTFGQAGRQRLDELRVLPIQSPQQQQLQQQRRNSLQGTADSTRVISLSSGLAGPPVPVQVGSPVAGVTCKSAAPPACAVTWPHPS